MSEHSEVATLVRAARKMRGMSREMLAAAVGRSRTTIRRLEAASPDAIVPLDLPLAEALVTALGHPPQSDRLLAIGAARGTSVRGRWAPPQPQGAAVTPDARPSTPLPSAGPTGAVRSILAERFGAAVPAPQTAPPAPRREASGANALRRAMRQIAQAAHVPLREGLSAVEWAAGASYVITTLATAGSGLAREGRVTGLIGELAVLAGAHSEDMTPLEPRTRRQIEAWLQASGEVEAVRQAADVLAMCWREPDTERVNDALLRGMSAAVQAPRDMGS